MDNRTPAYHITNAAQADIEQLYLNGAAQFGQFQADKYAAGLAAAFDRIARYPRLTRLRDEIDPPIRALPYGSHIILYDVDSEDQVTVVRVRHGREDWIVESHDPDV